MGLDFASKSTFVSVAQTVPESKLFDYVYAPYEDCTFTAKPKWQNMPDSPDDVLTFTIEKGGQVVGGGLSEIVVTSGSCVAVED